MDESFKINFLKYFFTERMLPNLKDTEAVTGADKYSMFLKFFFNFINESIFISYEIIIFVAFAMVKTIDDLSNENKGKCNLDTHYILLAFV